MSAPKRLLEDPGTLKALRADLQAVAQHQVNYDVSAGLARFEATLANLGPDLGPHLEPGASQGVAKSALVKAGIVGSVGAAIVGVALYWMESPSSEATPPMQTPTELGERVVQPKADPEPAKSGTGSADEAKVLLPPATAPARSSGNFATRAPLPKQVKPAPTEKQAAPVNRSDLLAEEVRQLRKIRESLNQNPAQALAWANEGHARFRRGHLYQEREALALRALDALGRQGELEQRGERYLRAFPNGSFSNQVRQMLGR